MKVRLHHLLHFKYNCKDLFFLKKENIGVIVTCLRDINKKCWLRIKSNNWIVHLLVLLTYFSRHRMWLLCAVISKIRLHFTSRGGMTTTHLYFKFMTVTISQMFASPDIRETSQITPKPQQIKRKIARLPFHVEFIRPTHIQLLLLASPRFCFFWPVCPHFYCAQLLHSKLVPVGVVSKRN